jgi:hypothetical protein
LADAEEECNPLPAIKLTNCFPGRPHNAASGEKPLRHDELAIELLHLPHKAAGVEEFLRHDELAIELLHLSHKVTGVEPELHYPKLATMSKLLN